METQVMRIRVSPEVLETIVSDVTISGETYGVYSAMTQMLTGGTNNTSLFTGLTVPVLLVQNTVDLGYYSVFDGAISQQNVVNNFLFSSTTSNPFEWYVYNTADIEFNAYLQLSNYFIDWGDGKKDTVRNYEDIEHIYTYSSEFKRCESEANVSQEICYRGEKKCGTKISCSTTKTYVNVKLKPEAKIELENEYCISKTIIVYRRFCRNVNLFALPNTTMCCYYCGGIRINVTDCRL
jgi:hypothetical protein